MTTLLYVIIFSLIGGLLSLSIAAVLISRESFALRMAYFATPFAAGALLAAVFLDLLPEGVHSGVENQVFVAALCGILLFFLAERFLRWFHHHHQHSDTDPSVSLIVVGDTMHNALDGVAIAAAFLISVPTGIVTTIAVAAHEIPQEIGDFGLLLHKGVRRSKVLLINVLSSLATVVAAIGTFALGSSEQLPLGVLLGLSAGFLLYIAMSDIIPTLHEKTAGRKVIDWQPVMLVVGLVVVALAINFTHGYVDTEHEQEDEHAYSGALLRDV